MNSFEKTRLMNATKNGAFDRALDDENIIETATVILRRHVEDYEELEVIDTVEEVKYGTP